MQRITPYSTICDPLRENRLDRQLLQAKIEACVDAVIIAVGDQKQFFYKEFKSSLLSQHSGKIVQSTSA